MYELRYEPETCAACDTLDCLMKCQHMDFNLVQARQEREKILSGGDSRVLKDCVTCYACEEYCPYGNHPFYLLVERQEQKGIWPVPIPLTKQQIIMMAPRGKITSFKVKEPVVNLCYALILQTYIVTQKKKD